MVTPLDVVCREYTGLAITLQKIIPKNDGIVSLIACSVSVKISTYNLFCISIR